MSTNKTSNSFATILSEFIRLQNNSLEQLQKVSQAVSSNAETVSIIQSNSDKTSSTYLVPSFGYLKSNIERIDNTISKMLGFDESDAYIRMPDGTFKKIYQAKNIVDPQPIGKVTVPSKFVAENNWFFEDLISPALKVNVDVSNYVPQEESKIFIKKFILNLDTDTKVDYFNNNLKGKNEIAYTRFLIDLQKNDITYFIDESVVDLPLSVVRYTGNFLVVNAEDRTYTNPDGTTSTKRWFLFDTVNYNDNLSLNKKTMVLKLGDKLVNGESIYEIVEIDNSTKFTRVKRLSGFEPFGIGKTISFYSEKFSPKIAKVGIGFNEYSVVFFKSVNDESNLISSVFSPGVGFYTNDLSIDLSTGRKSLKDFYNESVLDFGSMLLSNSKEKLIPAVKGLAPNAPVLNADNFKVVLINDHKIDQKEIVAIRKKQADKVRLSSQITELEKNIDRKKEELNTTKFNSETERRAVKNQLESVIKEKDTTTSLYTSIVKELAVTAQQKPAALDTPKYRIRGFFPIPDPVADETGQEQSVIQFYIYYRYVSPDGNTNDVKQFDFIDESGAVKRASYSNLIEVKSEIRKKEYSPTKGSYIWLNEDIEDPNAINVNQVDIPISSGEKVEFYVVSVSEAGWPVNPLLSEPSNTISITFPTDLLTEDEASIALKEASQDVVRVNLESDLQSKGLDTHLSSAFNAAEKYYAHSADVIASNFYTPEGNVITLFDKLTEMSLKIQDLEDRLNKIAGQIKVYILDEEKNTKIPIKEGDVIRLFAGYYTDEVDLLPTQNRRGAIITKSYKLYLENEEASPIQLISRMPGGISDALPSSENLTIFDADYNNYRKYDKTPIVNPSINSDDTNNENKIASSFYQSGQLRGQFLYSRYTDIGLLNPLYQVPPLDFDRYLLPIQGSSSTNESKEWVWNLFSNGGNPEIDPGDKPIGGGLLTNFCIHTDHPKINPVVGQSSVDFESLQTPDITIDINTGKPMAPEATSHFRHAYGFTEYGEKDGPAKQLEYSYNWGNAPVIQPNDVTSYTPEIDELPDKYGFIDNDRYLIGKDTCGSYLFLGPVTYNQLLINGVDARAYKTVQPGNNNALVIPIIFQYRMTDYYGPPITSSTSPGGYGIVGGYNVNPDTGIVITPPKNITYVRRIGLDLYQQDSQVFSFDIQVSSTYKKDSLIQLYETGVPAATKDLKEVTYDKTTVKSIYSQ